MGVLGSFLAKPLIENSNEGSVLWLPWPMVRKIEQAEPLFA